MTFLRFMLILPDIPLLLLSCEAAPDAALRGRAGALLHTGPDRFVPSDRIEAESRRPLPMTAAVMHQPTDPNTSR